MLRSWLRIGSLLLTLGLLLSARPARAVIAKPIALRDVLGESQFILTAKVDALDPDKPSVVLVIDEELKGKAPFRRLAVNLTGDSDAKKLDHTSQLLKRLAPNLPILLFATPKDKDFSAFAYTNGTWFQLKGSKEDDAVRWSFLHCEPNLRGTFKGTTAELKQIIVDVLAGKAKPPAPDPSDKGGLGPEVQPPEEVSAERWTLEKKDRAPVPAVIVPVLIGGPLAVLAMLFPAIFGGLVLVLRRWTAVLSVASLNSTLYAVYSWDWAAHWLEKTWLGSAFVLWLLMSLVTLAGLFWAWRRHLRAVQLAETIAMRNSVNAGTPALPPTPADARQLSLAERPRRGELIVLGIVSIVLVGLIGILWFTGSSLLAMPWKGLLVLAAGIWLGTLYTLVVRLQRPAGATVPVEGIVLGAMVVAALGLGGGWSRVAAEQDLVVGQNSGKAGSLAGQVSLTGQVWKFAPEGKGTINSSPLVIGERVYVAAAFTSVFNGDYGVVYCLDRTTGAKIWAFNEDNGQKMKQVFCSPCLADGRLYIGEGFHTDSSCKLYCLDATSGVSLWQFETLSHTESSPCVADGQVFFGAGDDGLYCLDALKGTPRWHYQKQIHIDANPVVVGNRLYCGGGVIGEAANREMGIFCLDTATGQEVWSQKTDLPVLGAPTVSGAHVFFGIGNGNFSFSDKGGHPAGALLCVEAATGKQVWRYNVPDSVATKPALDRQHVYFGSRDGKCYCLTRDKGELRWARPVGSPVLASPALADCSYCGASYGLYVLGSEGQAYCLDPATGDILWGKNLATGNVRLELFSSPAVVVTHEPGSDRRRIFFGAGLDNDITSVAAVYCFEDALKNPE